MLKRSLSIQETCICNPGLIRIDSGSEGERWLITFKIYWSIDSSACVRSTQPGGVWYEWFRGRQGYAVAVLLWPPGGGKIRVLNGTVVRKSNMEDARLFRDQEGKIRMLFNRHFLVHPLRVSLHVAQVEIGSDNHVRLRTEQVGGSLL